jgi:uncharacterized membrane protein (UPF0127 family)
MTKSTTKQQHTPVTKSKKKKNNINVRQILIIGVMILALTGLILPNMISLFRGGGGPASLPPAATSTPNTTNMPEPKFQKEGELSFISKEKGATLSSIEIEKADNDMEREFGLMYRRSMGENQGMLFLFDESTQQGFWMKNTYIPLDIMFVDENNIITTIHENATPQSEKTLFSKGNAKYVVEVVGGFVKKHGVKVGDSIKWN